MPKQQKCPECKGAPSWLTTFGDLMALLLTFFVLLLSFSATEQDDFEHALGSLQGALGVLAGEPILSSPIKLHVPIVKGDITEARPTLNDAKAEIEDEIAEEDQQENIEVLQGAEGLIIRIRDQALFDSGKADLKSSILPLLARIGGVLNRIPNPIEIEGHTDNLPISNDEFKNNHWLSNARALRVLDRLVEEAGIDQARLSAVGHGEFKPVDPDADNNTPENRSRNRRVEIKVRFTEGAGEVAPENVRKLLGEAELGTEGEEAESGP